MSSEAPNYLRERYFRLRLLIVTTFSIFAAEVLVMLLVESWVGHLPLLLRIFLDASLLVLCVFPTLYFLVFRKMSEQIERRLNSERMLEQLNRTLCLQVEERTARLQRANEDLLGEVRERARVGMALSQALKEANAGRSNLQAVINAISDGLLVVDAGGRIQLANQAAEELLGRSGYALTSQLLAELLAPAFAVEELRHFLALGDAGEVRTFQWKIAGQDQPQPITMRLGAACLWQDEPAAILVLKGGKP